MAEIRTPRSLSTSPLQDNITSTYFSLRLGIIVASALLPLALPLGGRLRGTTPQLLPSLSDYYFAGDPLLRDWFVGTLCAIGVFLYLYKGFSARENLALNVAGAAAVLTALVPCACVSSSTGGRLHDIAAVTFFASMAFVCLVCAPETLEVPADAAFKARYQRYYRVVGSLLIASPALAIAVSTLWGRLDTMKFFVETFGIMTFAAYWLVKSREFSHSQVEKRALLGHAVRLTDGGLIDASLGRTTPP